MQIELCAEQWSWISADLLTGLVTILSVFGNAVAQHKPPRFEDFPMEKRFIGKPVRVHLVSRESRRFRTAIKGESLKPPNFAGHYRVVEIGCGTACVQFFVIDSRTGQVFIPRFFIVWGLMEDQKALASEYQPQYRIDSKLLVAFGSRQNDGKGMYFYKWERRRFKLVYAALKKQWEV